MNRLLRIAVGLCVGVGLSSSVAAEVPHLVRYQGTAVDANNTPLEGPYTLIFRLYPAATGGTAVWTETHTNVPVTKGRFSILLGNGTPPTPLSVDWSVPLWISIQVGTDPELSPRQQITSVPLAIRAEVAESLATSAIPSGAIFLWAGSSCPAGYTRVSALDGKFLTAGTSYNPAVGGANTVTPSGTISNGGNHTHSVPNTGWGTGTNTWRAGYLAIGGAASEHGLTTADSSNTTGNAGDHGHTFSGSTFDNRPEFAMVLLCQKN